jgi:hypothetical protein
MAVASLPLLPGTAHASDTDLPVSTALGNKLSNGGEASLARTAASGDDVYVVWQDRTITGTGVADIALRHSTDRGATFGGVTNLSHTAFQDSRHPEIAASGDHVYVTWQQVVPPTESTSREEIWFTASDDRGASFSAPRRLDAGSASAIDPNVVADGGSVVVGWTASDGAVEVASSSDGGQDFGPPVHVGDGQWEAARPALAIQGEHVVAVWTTNTAAGIEAAASADGGTSFTAPVQVAAGDRVAPTVAMDEAGVAVAAWFARTENSNGTLETAESRDDGATWSAPNKVGPTELAPIELTESHGVFLLAASSGTTFGQTVWSAFDGDGFAQQGFYPGA